jgi:two-component system, NarL family, sensor histidine kinase DesK
MSAGVTRTPERRTIRSIFRTRSDVGCDDAAAAPARHHGSDAAASFTLRRAVQNKVWIYAFGLVFLLFAIVAIPDDDPSRAELAWRILLVVVIAVGYLATAWVADCSLRTRWLYIGGYVGVLLLSYPTWGWSLVGYGAYVAIMMATLLPWRQSRIAVVVLGLLIAATIPFGGGETAVYISVVAAGMGLATGAGMEAGAAQGRAQRAEQRVATLSVAAERERIGRDLHDILGHSLTAISIKAGLAARLVDLDPAAAKAQIAEIEQVSRQALADVRTTASGMHEVRLATEIASARSVLLAAGIESRMPSALPPLRDGLSELMGYVVREAVTNVVRHSRAEVCAIVVESTAVEVRDDGRGLPSGVRSGSGLVGLRRRVEDAGGTLQVGAGEDGGTVVRADFSASALVATPATSRETGERHPAEAAP